MAEFGLGGGRVPYPVYGGPFAQLVRDTEVERPTRRSPEEDHAAMEGAYRAALEKKRRDEAAAREMAEAQASIREEERQEDVQRGYVMAHPNEPHMGPVTPLAARNTDLMEQTGRPPSPWMVGHRPVREGMFSLMEQPTMGPSKRTVASTVYDLSQALKGHPVVQLLGALNDAYQFAGRFPMETGRKVDRKADEVLNDLSRGVKDLRRYGAVEPGPVPDVWERESDDPYVWPEFPTRVGRPNDLAVELRSYTQTRPLVKGR